MSLSEFKDKRSSEHFMDDPEIQTTSPAPSLNESSGGLLSAYGICEKMYRKVGGGEAFIRAQRGDFGSIVPVAPRHDDVERE
jgi:hypothetical protein